MNKAVMLSVQPKRCSLIANGKKTLEVRKTKPKIITPFKCYIYCTKPSRKHQTICGCMVLNSDELYRHPKQGIKYGDSIELMCCDDYTKDNFLNGKVIGEFVCDYIEDFNEFEHEIDALHRHVSLNACMDYGEIIKYLGNVKCGYGWHISNLRIYDEPIELCSFKKINRECWYADLGLAKRDCPECQHKGCFLQRPPQSWCYVEELR